MSTNELTAKIREYKRMNLSEKEKERFIDFINTNIKYFKD
jgi:Asp-tRNA(Asn)/Glu-tRNA(Gln) amidotransferase C subunit